MTAAVKLAQRILDERGYIVVAHYPGPKPPPEVGDVLQGPIDGVPGPFAVIAETDEADAIVQRDRYAGEEKRGLSYGYVLKFVRVVAE